MGLPLQVRKENFSSVGQTQNFSQTKSQTSEAIASPNSQTDSVSKPSRVVTVVDRLKPRKGILRYGLHAALIAGVGICVLSGTVNSQSDLANKKSGNDETSLIAASALLQDGSSVLGREVSNKAKDASGNDLTTAGDDFLSSKTPVLSSGAPSRDIMTYKVKDGDTLSSLSQKFSITTDTIKWANGIDDENAIKPGASLVILPVNGILHTVSDGDSMDSIAGRYQATASLIDSFNGLGGKVPATGTKIIVPDGIKVSAPAAVTAQIAATNAGPAKSTGFSIPNLSGPGSIGNSYSYGYCTWYVASRRAVPGNWGNAYSWLSAARAAGYATGGAPRAGAVAWEGGHVAYVESVNGDGTVTVSEMNFWGNGGGWGRRSYRTTAAGHFQYIY